MFWYKTTSNYWIDWNSAVLCFKRLCHIGVWTFARFVRPLLATILCVWEMCVWSGTITTYTMYHVFYWLAKQTKNKTRHRAEFEADLETGDFFGLHIQITSKLTALLTKPWHNCVRDELQVKQTATFLWCVFQFWLHEMIKNDTREISLKPYVKDPTSRVFFIQRNLIFKLAISNPLRSYVTMHW